MKTRLSAVFFSLLILPLWAMATGDKVRGEAKAITCQACHGIAGNSQVPNFPKLAGQHEKYVYRQLHAYAKQDRNDAMMNNIVASLSDQDMHDLAAYYASMPMMKVTTTETQEQNLLGRKLYYSGNKASCVPACIACHGPNGRGITAAGWPVISGQHQAYIEKSLTDYAAGQRGQEKGAKMMSDIVQKMTATEKQAVSHYIAKQLVEN